MYVDVDVCISFSRERGFMTDSIVFLESEVGEKGCNLYSEDP